MKLLTIKQTCWHNRRSLSYVLSLLLLQILNQPVLASGLGGFAGAAARFTADPLAAGTGGITLFHNTSTNSYSQNPAADAFMDGRSFEADLVHLSLDRFIYSVSGSAPLPPTAHLSFGILAAGTRNLAARDSRGYYAGELTDTEMAYLVSFANRFSDKLAIGLSFKLISRRLQAAEDWLDLKGSGFGAGLGLTYNYAPHGTLALALKDWNSGYKWKTQDVFDRGSSYTDEFPVSFSWGIRHSIATVTAALEHDHYFIGEDILRAAVIWTGIPNLQVQSGLSYEDAVIMPGVSARYELSWKQGPAMHLDLGVRLGIAGEGLRNYLGWGVTF